MNLSHQHYIWYFYTSLNGLYTLALLASHADPDIIASATGECPTQGRFRNWDLLV
jgi:hypothetical protein